MNSRHGLKIGFKKKLNPKNHKIQVLPSFNQQFKCGKFSLISVVLILQGRKSWHLNGGEAKLCTVKHTKVMCLTFGFNNPIVLGKHSWSGKTPVLAIKSRFERNFSTNYEKVFKYLNNTAPAMSPKKKMGVKKLQRIQRGKDKD